MTNCLKEEVRNERGMITRYRNRLSVLGVIENIRRPGTSYNATPPGTREPHRPAYADLKHAYEAISSALTRRFSNCAIKTKTERAISFRLSHYTSLQFSSSVWIGNRNVDLFCPSVGQLYSPIRKGVRIQKPPLMRGLVIEIDGGIHHSELKMKKDVSKGDVLNDLGMRLAVIENDDINDVSVRSLLSGVNALSRLDNRARKRVWRKVFVATLCCHADDQVMVDLYGPDFAMATKSLKEKGGKND